jgi:dihydroorotase
MFWADLNIIRSRLFVGNDLVEAGIAIEEGKIIKIGNESSLPKAEQTLNAKGLVAIPGLIDTHVHLRDLQLSYKEDFYSGTCAAAAGGFTTVFDMPNNLPPTNSASNLRLRRDAAANKIVTNVGFHACLVEDQTELQRMCAMGVHSFKLYMNDANSPIDTTDDSALKDVFSNCASMNVPITVHAEDREIIEKRLAGFRGKPLRPEDYSMIHGPEAESRGVERILEVTSESGETVHVCHVSLTSSINAIEKSRNIGTKVTCEITPQHLLLSRSDLERFGGWALTDPPLRDPRESKGLWKSLSDLSFITIASDHAPHSLPEKSSPDAREIRPGIPGLETTLPLLLTKVNRGELSLKQMIECLAERPARIFRLQGKGRLEERADADITLIDLNSEHTIDPQKFHSKAKYSPFAGQKCKGKASKVFIAGQLVFDEGEVIVPPGTGRILEGVEQ